MTLKRQIRNKATWFKPLALAACLPLFALGTPLGAGAVVVTDDGNSGAGSLRDVMGSAQNNDTISFAGTVTSIALKSGITTGKQNLILTGTPSAFTTELASVLTQYYQVDANSMPKALPEDFGMLLGASIAELEASFPSPCMSWEGAATDTDIPLLSFTANNSTASVQFLTFQGARHIVTTADIDNSGSGGSANTSISNKANGGALYINANGTIQGAVFLDNRLEARAGNAIAKDYVYANANAYGGGAYIGRAGTINFSIFTGNSASAQGGDAYTNDADAYAYANAYGGGAYIGGIGDISFSIFAGNSASAQGGHAEATNAYTYAYANAYANGGGAYLGGSGDISFSIFTGNSASAQGGDAEGNDAANTTAYTNGGGAYIGGSGDISSSIFARNSASAQGGHAETKGAYTHAYANVNGGGAYIGGAGAISSSVFAGNSVSAQGGHAEAANDDANNYAYADATATAYGGGAYIGGAGTISLSTFTGNSAWARGGSMVKAGTASFTIANADAYAFGGGLYLGAGKEHSIMDSSFLNNSLLATTPGTVEQKGKVYAPEAEARGGAVFVNTSEAISQNSPSSLTLAANKGQIVEISANTANGEASGIHFGRGTFDQNTGYFRNSTKNTSFTVRADGHILMLDPLTAELYRGTSDASGSKAAFSMHVQAASGLFVWGEKNVLDANGGSTVRFEKGSHTLFAADFTLTSSANKSYRTGSHSDAYARETRSEYNGNDLRVLVDDGAVLSFDVTRDPHSALFDFSNSTSKGTEGSFQLGKATLNAAIPPGQILNMGEAYLIADGIHNNDRDTAALIAGDYIVGFDTSKANQYWALFRYDSPYQSTIDMWYNLSKASFSLQTLLHDTTLVSNKDFLAVSSNLLSATPDHIMNQTVANLQTAAFVPGFALSLAFDGQKAKNIAPATGNADADGAQFRAWGGYIGRFVDQDSHSAYHGYDQDVHGAIAGFNADFARASLGVYAAYTNSQTKSNEAASDVDSDGYHLGVFGKIAPAESLPTFALSADMGWSHFDNEAERHDGTGRIRASFDQEVFTLGLGLEYGIELAAFTLTPFVNGRYAYLDQESTREHGGLTATDTDATNGSSLTTDIGAKARWRAELDKGSVEGWLAASWQHEYGDTDFASFSRYSATPVSGVLPGYSVRSVETDRDTANLGIGLRTSRNLESGQELGLNLGYNANIGGDRTVHSVSALLEIRF